MATSEGNGESQAGSREPSLRQRLERLASRHTLTRPWGAPRRARLLLYLIAMLVAVTGMASGPARAVAVGYPAGSIDEPGEGATVTGSLAVTGWAIDAGATGDGTTGVDRVRLYLDGILLGDATYNRPRPDIASAYGAQFGPSGFRYLVDTSGLAPGSHRLEARAHSTVTGTETNYARTVNLAAPTATPVIPPTPTSTPVPVGYPAGGLDAPADGVTVTGSVALSGWAIDQAASTGTGVDRVRIYLDGVARADAQYGLARPDIAAAYGSRFGPSGFTYSLDLSGVAAGSHTLETRAHSAVTGAEAVSRRTIVVTTGGDPRGGIEQPAEAAQVGAATTTAVSGYALDLAAPTGTGVDRVRVLVDGAYRGDAQYGLARSDVAAIYGSRYTSTGYRYSLDLTGLSAGTHYVEARAHSTANGAEAPYIHSIVVVGAPATLTPTPVASADPRFGTNAHLLYDGLDRAAADLDRIRAAGLGMVRVDVQWDLLEPTTPGAFDDGYLSKLDGVLAQTVTRGTRPIIVVVGTPAWARGGIGSRFTPPSNPDQYADALGRLAGHVAGRLPDQLAPAYEIWNEPNQAQFWDAPGGPNPIAYAALLKAAYPRIKAADPRSPVLGGSITFNDRDYLEDLYALGGIAGSFDGLAIHPYSDGISPDSAGDGYHSFALAVEQLGQVMIDHGEPAKPIWITEMGWSTNTVAEATRATYFQQAVRMVRSWPRVVAFCAYQLSEDQDRPDFGMIAPDGTASATWQAYAGAVAVR